MTKVYPLKMDDPLWARIQKAADKTHEAEAVVMRIALRAGLAAMEREHYELLGVTKADFSGAGEPTGASVGGPSTPSPARLTPSEESTFMLKEKAVVAKPERISAARRKREKQS